MHFSYYDNNKFDRNTLFFENLKKLPHFFSTVRTPPNKYHYNFIGELKSRNKPYYDTLFTNSFQKSPTIIISDKILYIHRKKIKQKSYNLPKIFITNHNYNSNNQNKNKIFFKNEINNGGDELGFINLNFPYCKPMLKTSKTNVFINKKYKLKNKGLNTVNIEKNDNKKGHRLFFKSFSNFHQIIKKIKQT